MSPFRCAACVVLGLLLPREAVAGQLLDAAAQTPTMSVGQESRSQW